MRKRKVTVRFGRWNRSADAGRLKFFAVCMDADG
jgi:hypothetical protein